MPLSLVGTFGVMYLLGYSLNNLTLMALTISTGFVVDDAIVMIENISRYIEEGERPLEAALEGRGADRVHHRFADGFADRGADPAAVHGRHRGPPVPRVRGDAERDDSGVGDGLADADADDVRRKLLKHTPEAAQGRFYRVSEHAFERIIAFYGRTLQWVLRHQTATLLVAAGDAGADRLSVLHRAQGIFPDAGYRRDSGVVGSCRRPFLSRRWRSGSRRWRK